MAFNPAGAGLAAGGIGLSILGGILDRNSALENAKREAEARNASLAKNIGILQGFGADNRGVFDANMSHYAPATQGAELETAQTTRGNANAGNISAINTDQPIPADASPASRSDLAKRMLALHDASTARAKAQGKLGGYSDQWINNQLADKQATRDVGVTNNYAEGRKALVQPESDLAAAAAYKPPSIWGSVLKGLGGFGAAAGGANLFNGAAPSVWETNPFLAQQPEDI